MGERDRLDWSHRAEHLRTRSQRHAGDLDIDPAWADEAFADPAALVESPDHASTSGSSDRLVGYSSTARMVLTVIYLREPLTGLSAWKANDTDERRYWQEVQ